MDQFDDTIYNIIESATKNSSSVNNALLSEALIAAQKVIRQSEIIKSAIAKKKVTDNAGKLLLLCAELEKVNSLLLQIKHEYNL